MAKMLNKVLIHPVDFDCNMACGYCYNGSFGRSVLNSERVISDKLLFKIFDEVYDWLVSDKLMVIWHGGEPLLAGKEFFRNAIKIQTEAARGRYVIKNGIQTNGTLVDEEWVDLCAELGIVPSVSLDGPLHLHDKVRTFSDGSSTYSRALSGYNLFRERMRTGLLLVVSRSNVREAEAIWRWILDQRIDSLDFLPCFEPEGYRAGRTFHTITEAEIAKFSIKLFDLWFDHADPAIKIRTFKDGIKGQLGGRVNVCSWKGGCLTHVSLDPDGNVFPCGRYHCYPETSFGSLNNLSFSGIMDGAKTRSIHAQIAEGQKECAECCWYPICHSGCPFLKYAVNGHWGGSSIHCQSRKVLFSYIRKRILA